MNQDDLWDVRTLMAFNYLNFDKVLNQSNLEGNEQSIKLGKNPDDYINGFEAYKRHKDSTFKTTYFIPTAYAAKLPIIVDETLQVRFKNRIYQVVKKATSLKIIPENILGFRALVDCSGIATHSNHLHYTIYKLIVLTCRLGKGCFRVCTESAFGKDKYLEMNRLLLSRISVLTDPTIAKINNRIQHDKLLVLSEMPGKSTGEDFSMLCNALMIIGDDRQILDNRARSAQGTLEEANIGKTSVLFIHNPSSYYEKVGKKSFEDTFPYNVQNRYLPFRLFGHTECNFTDNLDNEEYAAEYKLNLQAWIKTAVWYEENWHSLKNKYSDIGCRYVFAKKEERYATNFSRLALAISLYSRSQEEYVELLEVAYQSYLNQKEEQDKGKHVSYEEVFVRK